MRRALFFLTSFGLITACANSPTAIGPLEAIARAQHQTRVELESNDYSRFTIARYAELTGDPITASQSYADLIRRSATDAALAERAVFASLLIDDFDTAAAKASRIEPAVLADADLTRLTLAVDRLASRRSAEAETYLQGPWRSPFHHVLAQSLLAWSASEADPEGATKLQTMAGQDDPVLSSVAAAMSGVLLMNAGKTDEALALFEALWNKDTRIALAVEAEARGLARTGDPDKALLRLTKFRDEVGRHPALTQLELELKAGQSVEATDLTIRQGAALAIYAATAALADQSTSDLPAVYFALALELDPKLDAARTLSAKALDRANRFDDAEQLLRSIRESSIYHTSAQGQLAWVLRRKGQDAEALSLAQSTLERTNDRNIRIQLADLYQSLGRDGEAEQVLTDIIAADEESGVYDWRLFFARGAVRERQGKWPPAENDLETALGLNPEDSNLLNYLGYSWIDRGENLEEGLQLIQTALRLEPSSGAILDSLGWANYKLGKYDRAVFYLERAIEKRPQDPVILDHLGDVYWQVGRYTEAGYQWTRALQYLDQEAPEYAAIESKLRGEQTTKTPQNTNTSL
ncbi:MAG: tetratricopeptide repeat protein [Pseudomonadota bacterium]